MIILFIIALIGILIYVVNAFCFGKESFEKKTVQRTGPVYDMNFLKKNFKNIYGSSDSKFTWENVLITTSLDKQRSGYEDNSYNSTYNWCSTKNVFGQSVLPSIHDQNPCGTCWAFVCADLFNFYATTQVSNKTILLKHLRNLWQIYDLSAQQLISCNPYVTSSTNLCDEGLESVNYYLGDNFIKPTFFYTDKKYPYQTAKKAMEPSGSFKSPRVVYSTELPCRRPEPTDESAIKIPPMDCIILEYNVEETLEARIQKLKTFIFRYGPVFYLNDFNPQTLDSCWDKSSFIVDVNKIECTDFCHVTLITGWKTINDKQYWIYRNSWGPYWGDGGYCYIPIDGICGIFKENKNTTGVITPALKQSQYVSYDIEYYYVTQVTKCSSLKFTVKSNLADEKNEVTITIVFDTGIDVNNVRAESNFVYLDEKGSNYLKYSFIRTESSYNCYYTSNSFRIKDKKGLCFEVSIHLVICQPDMMPQNPISYIRTDIIKSPDLAPVNSVYYNGDLSKYENINGIQFFSAGESGKTNPVINYGDDIPGGGGGGGIVFINCCDKIYSNLPTTQPATGTSKPGTNGQGYGAGGGGNGGKDLTDHSEGGGYGKAGFAWSSTFSFLSTGTVYEYNQPNNGLHPSDYIVIMGGGGGGGKFTGGCSGNIHKFTISYSAGDKLKVTIGNGGTSGQNGGDTKVEYSTSKGYQETYTAYGGSSDAINFDTDTIQKEQKDLTSSKDPSALGGLRFMNGDMISKNLIDVLNRFIGDAEKELQYPTL